MQISANVFSLSGGAPRVLEVAHIVEAAGWDEIDLGDHVVLARPTATRPANAALPIAEPLVTLAAVAMITSRLRLGTEVLVLPQRQPPLVAKQVATLDVISNGRMRLGVGVGWQEPEFEALGVPFRERGQRMDECIELLRLYWSGEPVTYDGRFYKATAMAVDQPPLQPGGPKVWLGGGADAALQRVGRLADGWMAVFEDPAHVRAKVETIRQAAERAGRDPSAIGLHDILDGATDLDGLARQAAVLKEAGFSGVGIDLTQLGVTADLAGLEESSASKSASTGKQADFPAHASAFASSLSLTGAEPAA